MSAISIRQLLEAGVHFGHQTSRWNPKMKEFIFGERNGIHIIDLQQTLKLFRNAVDFLTDVSSVGKEVLFVGTKRQALEAIEEDALRCGMHFVTNRWLGGLLTNFTTVQKSIERYKKLEAMKEDGFYEKLGKKEIAKLERERKKLEKNLIGIRDMGRLPDVLFVIDSEKESIAVKEAAKLGIPIIAIVDTNCNPDLIDFVIPGNDDALRSVKLFTSTIADAVLAGRSVWDAKVEEERLAREKAEKEAAAARAAREAAEAERAKKAAEAAEARKKAEKEQKEAETAAAAMTEKAKAAKTVEAEAASGDDAEPAKEAAATEEKADAAPEKAVATESKKAKKEEASKPEKTAEKPAVEKAEAAGEAEGSEKEAEAKAEPAAAKKAAPRKAATKRTAPKKPAAKKTAAKKPAAKKAVEKPEATEKKTTARKATAKRTTTAKKSAGAKKATKSAKEDTGEKGKKEADSES